VLYYAKAITYLIDRSVLDISALAAIVISIALLVVGWLVYEALLRLLDGHDRLLAAALSASLSRRVWREPRVQRAGELHPGGRDDRHVDGGQRPVCHNPRPVRVGRCQVRGSRA
jgi:hypothetical protein